MLFILISVLLFPTCLQFLPVFTVKQTNLVVWAWSERLLSLLLSIKHLLHMLRCCGFTACHNQKHHHSLFIPLLSPWHSAIDNHYIVRLICHFSLSWSQNFTFPKSSLLFPVLLSPSVSKTHLVYLISPLSVLILRVWVLPRSGLTNHIKVICNTPGNTW